MRQKGVSSTLRTHTQHNKWGNSFLKVRSVRNTVFGALPICDLPRHFRSNMWSTFRNPSYCKWCNSSNPLVDKCTNGGMCSSVVFVAQFTCLRFDVTNTQQCRATWNSLRQLYLAKKWLYNIYAKVICWIIRRKLWLIAISVEVLCRMKEDQFKGTVFLLWDVQEKDAK